MTTEKEPPTAEKADGIPLDQWLAARADKVLRRKLAKAAYGKEWRIRNAGKQLGYQKTFRERHRKTHPKECSK